MTEEEKRLKKQAEEQNAPAPEMRNTQQTIEQPAPDEGYNQAMGALQANAKPSYTGTYDAQISELFNQIMNRDKFSYDASADALYQNYVDQYTNLGRMAMRDTMGQAAALTGGYGSSYSQAAGQQRYDRYLQDLTGMMPELYGQAYQRYQDEGSALMQQYGMLGDLRDREYDMYLDEYNRYWNERDYNYNHIMQLINATGYTPTAEEMSAAGMTQSQVDLLLKAWKAQNPGLYNSLYGGGTAGGGGGRGWELRSNGSLEDWQIKEMQEYYGVTPDGMWGPESSRAAYDLSADNAWDRYLSETGGGDTGNYELYRGLMQGVRTAGTAQNADNYINNINPSDLATLSNAQFESLLAATKEWKNRS